MNVKKLKRRDIKIEVTDDISKTGLTDEEYDVVEKYYENGVYDNNSNSSKVKDSASALTPSEEDIILTISKIRGIDIRVLRGAISDYKYLKIIKESDKVI